MIAENAPVATPPAGLLVNPRLFPTLSAAQIARLFTTCWWKARSYCFTPRHVCCLERC